jgi:hypothetical protein
MSGFGFLKRMVMVSKRSAALWVSKKRRYARAFQNSGESIPNADKKVKRKNAIFP